MRINQQFLGNNEECMKFSGYLQKEFAAWRPGPNKGKGFSRENKNGAQPYAICNGLADHRPIEKKNNLRTRLI